MYRSIRRRRVYKDVYEIDRDRCSSASFSCPETVQEVEELVCIFFTDSRMQPKAIRKKVGKRNDGKELQSWVKFPNIKLKNERWEYRWMYCVLHSTNQKWAQDVHPWFFQEVQLRAGFLSTAAKLTNGKNLSIRWRKNLRSQIDRCIWQNQCLQYFNWSVITGADHYLVN